MHYHLLTYPHKALREVSQPISDFNAILAENIEQMFALLDQTWAPALCAPQLGLPAQLFVMDVSLDKSQPRYFVNPTVLEKKNEIHLEQVCLSFPGCMLTIPRFNDIKLAYDDKNGEQKVETFSGIEAACIQHQVELLNGILFIDHLSKLKRERFLKKYESERSHGSECNHGCSHD